MKRLPLSIALCGLLSATACEVDDGGAARTAARVAVGEAPERVIYEEETDPAGLLRITRLLVEEPQRREDFLAELRSELERLEAAQ